MLSPGKGGSALATGRETLPPFQRTDWRSLLAKVPDAARPGWEEFKANFDAVRGRWGTGAAEFSLSVVGRMHAAGVPIGTGTDTPIGTALPPAIALIRSLSASWWRD